MRDFKVYQTSGMLNFLVSEASDVRKKEQKISGGIVNFTADAQSPMKFIVDIDSTGRTGCNIYHTGKNICDLADAGIATKSLYNLSSGNISIGGGGATLSGTNPITITNTTNWRGAVFFSKELKAGYTYKLRYRMGATTPANVKRTMYLVNSANNIVSKVGYASSLTDLDTAVLTLQFTATADRQRLAFSVESSSQQTITVYDIAINYPASNDYTPYSGTTYPISWQTEAGAVYGGTLIIDYDGSVTLETGGQTYTLTSVSPIETLIGDNNIWADAGPVSVIYPI